MFNSLKSIILSAFLGVIILTTGSIMVFVYHATEGAILHTGDQTAKDLLQIVVLNVENQYKSIESQKELALTIRKKELKNLTTVAFAGLENIYAEYKEGQYTEQQAKDLAVEELKKIRYDHGIGYFWINDTGKPIPKMIMHPTNPKLDGKVLDDQKFNCAQGIKKNMFQAFVEVCDASGEGYVDYLWKKPTHDGWTEEQPKLSFVKLFKDWNWIIGTGVYIDDIENFAKGRYDDVLEELKENFSKIHIGQRGYMFIFDGKRNILVQPPFMGENIFKTVNPSTGNFIADDFIRASLNPDKPFEYLWDADGHKGEFRFLKRSYIHYFKPLDWYIGTSVYNDDLKQPATVLIRKILGISLILMMITFLFSMMLSRKIVAPIQNLIDAAKGIEKAGIEGTNIPIEGAYEIRELAKILDKMIISIREGVNEWEHLLIALADSNDELKTVNEQLEEKVKDRTAEILEAKELAEHANQQKSDFLSSVSHEIRTPLNCIMGYNETLILKSEEEETKKLAKTVLRESETLLQLINDLLDNAKIEAGKMELEFIPMNLMHFFDGINSSAIGYIGQKNIEFKLDIAQGVPKYVIGDSLRLRQIVMNLISNAVKFTEKGSVTFKVEVIEKEEDKVKLRYSVIDTGIGIPQEKQKYIFQSFSQAGSDTYRKYGGTGLGTTIAQQLVNKMEGQMGVESEYGEGCLFWFEIFMPLSQRTEVLKQDHRDEGIENQEPKNKGRILIAEDYPANQEVVKMHLKNFGHSYQLVSNGRDAIKACEEHDFDLIYLDIQMPIMDGYEAAQGIRSLEKYQKTPIVAMTASSDSQTKQRCAEEGIDDIITKPIRRKPFLVNINKWLSIVESKKGFPKD